MNIQFGKVVGPTKFAIDQNSTKYVTSITDVFGDEYNIVGKQTANDTFIAELRMTNGAPFKTQITLKGNPNNANAANAKVKLPYANAINGEYRFMSNNPDPVVSEGVKDAMSLWQAMSKANQFAKITT